MLLPIRYIEAVYQICHADGRPSQPDLVQSFGVSGSSMYCLWFPLLVLFLLALICDNTSIVLYLFFFTDVFVYTL